MAFGLRIKSECLWLIVRAISFQDFQPICASDPPTSQTDRPTDIQSNGRTTCKTALYTVVHRVVIITINSVLLCTPEKNVNPNPNF